MAASCAKGIRKATDFAKVAEHAALADSALSNILLPTNNRFRCFPCSVRYPPHWFPGHGMSAVLFGPFTHGWRSGCLRLGLVFCGVTFGLPSLGLPSLMLDGCAFRRLPSPFSPTGRLPRVCGFPYSFTLRLCGCFACRLPLRLPQVAVTGFSGFPAFAGASPPPWFVGCLGCRPVACVGLPACGRVVAYAYGSPCLSANGAWACRPYPPVFCGPSSAALGFRFRSLGSLGSRRFLVAFSGAALDSASCPSFGSTVKVMLVTDRPSLR